MNEFQGNVLIQNQQLVISPKMLEELKILQMSNVDLMHYIEEQLVINPILEIDDFTDYSNSSDEISCDDEYYIKSYYQKETNNSSQTLEYKSKEQTLSQYLLSQLGECSMPAICKKAAIYLINNLDDRGYLCISLKQAALALNVSLKVVKAALKIVWSLEPDGVGARNLKECLLIQLSKKGLLNETSREIIKNYLELLGERKYTEISLKTGLSKEQIIVIHKLIKTLSPKPGNIFEIAKGEELYIRPELEVKEIGSQYQVFLTRESVLNLRISSYYKKLIGYEKSNKETNRYIRNKLSKAIEIINAIEQRNRTVLNIASCIIEYQTEFLKKGYKLLKPLTMKMVADKVGLHESTVSRAVGSKYISTPRGIFELKYFFSSHADSSDALNVSSISGVSANGVKKLIYELIKCEDPSSPMSDEQLRGALEREGIKIARRTVAKYRTELNILPVLLRK